MIAHINVNKEEETVFEHCEKTAEIAKQIGAEYGLGATAYLSAYLHDFGKLTSEFETYLRTVAGGTERWKKEKLNHSSAGGKYLIEEFPIEKGPGRATEELIAWAIFSHHGVNDMVSVEKENSFLKRVNPEREIYYQEAFANFREKNSCDIGEWLKQAQEEVRKKVILIRKSCIQESNADFFMGMLARLVLSILIDSDRTATCEFMNGTRFHSGEGLTSASQQERRGILGKEWNLEFLWSELEEKLNKNIKELGKRGKENGKRSPHEEKLSMLRGQISEQCDLAGDREPGIYTLQVPTGGGKTLAGMRFALHHAGRYQKKRIFYIAPYKSILEQNAQVYRNIFGGGVLLEYHSDIVVEEEGEEYQTLTENFGAPIVLTTMVQFLNTFFSDRTQCVRRMHAFADAVILLDEVQSIPVHMIHLFNCAMNFMKICCGSTVVLCSATQPLFGETGRPIKITGEIIGNAAEIGRQFKRSTIIDRTELHSCQEIAEFALERMEESDSGLVIANTKKAARLIFEAIREKEISGLKVFHLSTNMCPQHRSDIFEEFKRRLKEKRQVHEKVICISTQLIEAGVDISADFVIRTLAGWDSIMQAAGRCNRNAECETGYVYVVQCEEEQLSKLPSILEGRKNAYRLLEEFRKCPELYDNDLLSPKAAEMYYRYYFKDPEQKNKMDYWVKEDDTTIFAMLSNYGKDSEKTKKLYLKQAFREAGKKFKAIDTNTRGVIVPYQKGRDMIQKLNSQIYYAEITDVLRAAQRYTINIQESKFQYLIREKVISKLYACDAYYLEEQYFDEKVGIKERAELEELIF
ncbi:MAG: CRISPR-associated helicase Cas3' [Lachnospiraceae bacterium]|nr:CRISPR-associated helicase Cas3' [Lachnospiraceae bacterium]